MDSWTQGPGRLGFLHPLLGNWKASAGSDMGPVRCSRHFAAVLGGAYIRLEARWEFGGAAQVYEEEALIGTGDDGKVCFWSFTSDGKRSQGTEADVTDLHPRAVGFEAQMPAGLARMAYWPDEDSGFVFVVESREPTGWNRFVEHRYHPA
jgi:hypothetical protein